MRIKLSSLSTLIGLNIIPGILFHLLIMPVWLFLHPNLDWIVSLVSLLFNILLLPLILFIINFKFNFKYGRYGFILNMFLMLLSMVIWNSLDYLNWGISNKRGFILHPDIETIAIFKMVLVANFFTIILGSLILGIILFLKKRRNSTSI